MQNVLQPRVLADHVFVEHSQTPRTFRKNVLLSRTSHQLACLADTKLQHRRTQCCAHIDVTNVKWSMPTLQLRQQLLGVVSAGCLLLVAAGAEAADKIGEFSASGFIFKDSVEAVSVEDPDVKGVTIYISDFHRSLPDKLNKDFFNEPSQASVTCALTGPLQIADYKAISGAEGHEVFSERKGLNLFQNKTLRVRRLYDSKNSTLLYVAYSTRIDGSQNATGSRYKTSICALPVSPAVAPAVTAQSAQMPKAMQ